MEKITSVKTLVEKLGISYDFIVSRPMFKHEDGFIQKLDLSNCDISHLPDGIFDTFLELTYLDISYNNLKNIPSDLFIKNTRLEFLSLEGNDIDFDENQFIHIPDLIELKISFGKRAVIFNDLLKKQSKLTTLYLSSVQTLPRRLLSYTPNIRVLFLKSDKPLSAGFFKDIHPQILNISGQRKISKKLLDDLNSLEELYITDCIMEEIPKDLFDSLESLKTLYLNGNTTKYIEDGAFSSLKNLEELDISENKLIEIPENLFNDLFSLRILNLRNNKLDALVLNNVLVQF